MKENVDLTLNRDFGKRQRIIKNIRIERTHDPKDEVVFTGNKKEREYKKFWDKDTGGRMNSCDRCGDSIKHYAWDIIESSLCRKCDDLLDTGGDSIPWRRKR